MQQGQPRGGVSWCACLLRRRRSLLARTV